VVGGGGHEVEELNKTVGRYITILCARYTLADGCGNMAIPRARVLTLSSVATAFCALL